ncbi:RNA polymerase sigma factor sigM [Actinoplanes sp. SE50]|uniref:RNA polymerase sigma factor n=1 Tax=unclassified Actinoplanes TaxID=2626549 RepID=UPI00023EC852|nr:MULTISPECIES: sigma-70 family RNA polymerase sigma factor [unclassified Actinoplanes]AEV86490.1 RNA polymerase sigma factor sigM [Actinoplanes sp. SE50/110]ATO84888.1 RNA polymerase sigma factor sigM [Actinoplanes sp. SE50]SLM02297.1 RNA polymerase sigma factor sigM [Actinoplanes sp. SE50/110]
MPVLQDRPGHDRQSAERRLEELFRLHADAVLTFLRHRTDHETAQDVLTETFTIAWRKLGEIPEDPRGWLYGVARRVLANHVRSQGRTAAVVERMRHESRLSGPDESGIEDALHRHDVLAALAVLPEADREVLLLAGWYDLTGAQAARALDCTRAAYALRLHRARRRLRGVLSGSATARGTTSAARPAREANV